MEDRIQINGVTYVKEQGLYDLQPNLEALRAQIFAVRMENESLKKHIKTVSSKVPPLVVESVEPIYRKKDSYLKLMFKMPMQKFNPGDEVCIFNVTKRDS